MKVFLEWGRTNGDYQCLKYGLRKAGRDDLWPPKRKWPERPLAWWATLKHWLGAEGCGIPLSLGRLHRLMFPEDPGLSEEWHHAGLDLSMTIRLIKYSFNKVRNTPIPGKLGSYFRPIRSEGRMENLHASPGEFSAEIQDEPTEWADIEDDGLLGSLMNKICWRQKSMTQPMRSGIRSQIVGMRVITRRTANQRINPMSSWSMSVTRIEAMMGIRQVQFQILGVYLCLILRLGCFAVLWSRVSSAFILDFLHHLLSWRVCFQRYFLPFGRSLVSLLNRCHELIQSRRHGRFQDLRRKLENS